MSLFDFCSKRKSTGSKTKRSTSARKGGRKKKTRKVKKKTKTTRKSSSSKKKDDLQMEKASSNTVIPDFHLFGGRDDLMFFGDNEELYANENKPR